MWEERAAELTQQLVRIKSITFHEEEAAAFLAEHMRGLGFTVETDRHNNVIAELKGSGGGKRLMFLGHHDVVEVGDLSLWKHDPWAAVIDGGLMYGRGTNDEKGGIGACIAAIEQLLKEHPEGLRGDILFLSTREETLDIETRGVLEIVRNGAEADGCICLEPTQLQLALGQKGRAIVDISTHGKAAHGARPDQGVNAINHMAHLLREIEELELPLRAPLGRGTQCVGKITGGIRANMVAEQCAIEIDRRTVSGETLPGLYQEYNSIIDNLARQIPNFKAKVSIRPPFHPSYTEESEEIVVLAKNACEAVGLPAEISYLDVHTDAEWIINDLQIPSIVWGPGDIATAHAANEVVPVEELRHAARLYHHVMTQMLL